MAGAGELATLNPSSCSISLNILANISYEALNRVLAAANKGLWSKLGSFGLLYIAHRTIGLLER